MSRPNLEEIYGRLETLKRAGSTLYRDDLEALLPYVAELEAEIDDLRVEAREKNGPYTLAYIPDNGVSRFA